MLNSTIPDWIAHVASLETLNFENNRLYGIIPDSIMNLQSLQFCKCEIEISFTLHGYFPSNLTKLKSLGK